MINALDSGSSGPGSSPGRDIVFCSWGRHFTLTVPLFTQENQMGTGEFNTGGNPAMDQHPIQPELRAGPMGHMARKQALPCFTFSGNAIHDNSQ